MDRLYTTKNTTSGSIKDVSAKDGFISGYAADFDTIDSDGDIFRKGAFKKTITENKSRIMHLLQHDTTKPFGRPDVLIEDAKGLKFEETITSKQREVSYIKDALLLMESGVFNEHSVGFMTLQSHGETVEEKSVNIITETKLFEFSTVTFGANPNTPLVAMKGEGGKVLADRIDTICKALRVGNLTDDTYIKLEIELQQIKSLVSELQPSKKDTDTNKLIEPKLAEQFLKSIKI